MLTADKTRKLTTLGRANPDHYMQKFCIDPQHWMREAGRLARTIPGRESRCLRILDIGCGFGYFLDACRDLGHDVIGVDMPDSVIEQAAGILDIPFRPLAIKACNPLPDDLTGFDLVTTFGVMFRHGCVHASHDYWGWPEYAFLARDICNRLNPTGRWGIRPNRQVGIDAHTADLNDTGEWLTAVGDFATLDFDPRQITIRPNKYP